ncbi:MAG: hypothetical protein QOH61_2467 [Chloroflexota bacterium]|nr:hypothetical protein [Chloroflexota bacterium]
MAQALEAWREAERIAEEHVREGGSIERRATDREAIVQARLEWERAVVRDQRTTW